MTILDAIHRVNVVKPNSYGDVEKVKWLSVLDGLIKSEIIDTHEGGENVTFDRYDDETDLTTVLLVPPPYAKVYIHWLEAQIDYANGEYDKYENSMEMYNTAYTAYENYYNRTHMPKSNRFKFF